LKHTQFKLNAELEQSHWWFTARRKVICGLVHEILEPGKDRLIIDVGCGTGANIASLAHEYSVIGFDVSEDAIQFARERFPDVDFRRSNAIEYLNSVANQDVLILLNDVLEHVEFDRSFFRALFDAAPVGATFLVTVPAGPDLWSPHDVSHGHYRRYTRETFNEIWAGLPVSALLFSHYNSRLYPLVRALRKLTGLTSKSVGEGDTDLTKSANWINHMLDSIFSGELTKLLAAIRNGGEGGYDRGVSLIAVLKKTETA
jgi:SAM-dependent methyltransferase